MKGQNFFRPKNIFLIGFFSWLLPLLIIAAFPTMSIVFVILYVFLLFPYPYILFSTLMVSVGRELYSNHWKQAGYGLVYLACVGLFLSGTTQTLRVEGRIITHFGILFHIHALNLKIQKIPENEYKFVFIETDGFGSITHGYAYDEKDYLALDSKKFPLELINIARKKNYVNIEECFGAEHLFFHYYAWSSC